MEDKNDTETFDILLHKKVKLSLVHLYESATNLNISFEKKIKIIFLYHFFFVFFLDL